MQRGKVFNNCSTFSHFRSPRNSKQAEPLRNECESLPDSLKEAEKPDPRIRVVVVHENRLLRETLAVALSTQARSLHVVGCLADASRLRPTSLDQQCYPDVILLGGWSGNAQRSRQALLHHLYKDAAVILIGAGSFMALLRGIYIIGQGLRRGRKSMTGQDAAGLKGPAHVVAFTAREREILQLRQKGMSHKEVATALGLEVQTVKNHMRNLSLKLQLIRWSTPRFAPDTQHPEPDHAAQEV
jgi:DNA-binding CsgD family transcriptional regulator